MELVWACPSMPKTHYLYIIPHVSKQGAMGIRRKTWGKYFGRWHLISFRSQMRYVWAVPYQYLTVSPVHWTTEHECQFFALRGDREWNEIGVVGSEVNNVHCKWVLWYTARTFWGCSDLNIKDEVDQNWEPLTVWSGNSAQCLPSAWICQSLLHVSTTCSSKDWKGGKIPPCGGESNEKAISGRWRSEAGLMAFNVDIDRFATSVMCWDFSVPYAKGKIFNTHPSACASNCPSIKALWRTCCFHF